MSDHGVSALRLMKINLRVLEVHNLPGFRDSLGTDKTERGRLSANRCGAGWMPDVFRSWSRVSATSSFLPPATWL